MQDYRKLEVWQRAHRMVLDVYELTESFPKSEIFGLVSQCRRASVSIPANIAEGCGKNSNNDFANFLNIALGSVNEVEYYFLLSKDLNYLDDTIFNNLNQQLGIIKGMLISLIIKIRQKT